MRQWAPVAWGILLLAAAVARAEQVSIPASRDQTLYSEDGSASNGLGKHLLAGANNDSSTRVLRRALVAFDVAAAIPSGSTIQSATLTLHLSRTQTGDQGVALHRVLTAWGEGTSVALGEEGQGADATPGDATWTQAFWPATPWTNPGGDFATASASAVVGSATVAYDWSSAQMTSDVQAWLDDPAGNQGWILLGNESVQQTTKRFDSRNHADPNVRPLLLVQFTPPAASGACCAADGGCTVVGDPGSGCSGSYQGVGSSCAPNPCPQPAGACCLPDATATCLSLTQAACATQSGAFQAGTTCALAVCPVVLQPFVDPLPIPAVARPVSGTAGGAASYRLAMREVKQKLHRDLPPTTVWGFADGAEPATSPGPTLEASVGQPVEVTWSNDLRDASGALRSTHYLPVDMCPHGAMDASPRTVVHLHGGHVPEAFDGSPDATFLPGQQVDYAYPNQQLPAALWYHDHALGITRLNVMMGLAGLYLLRDPVEQALGLPSGEYEIPLVLQDRSFAPDGSLRYPAMWHEHFFGDAILVNGKVWPFLEVKRGKYRFRIANASNSRTYRLRLSNGAGYRVIGTDGGLLPAPVFVNQLALGPGERADVIIDFAPFAAGSAIVLTNDAPAPFPGSPGVGVVPNVLRFVVTSQTGHTAAVPFSLRPLDPLLELEASVTRTLSLRKSPEPCTGSAWFIDGLGWNDITEFPRLGTSEIWSFANHSGVTHPMHLHLVMFQVLDRQPFDEVEGQIVPTGPRVAPPASEAGWKDTVQVGPHELTRVIARFEDFTGRFAYHCHILEHEDHAMMRQFETTTVCGDGVLGSPAEECDDGNLVSGDCCSPTCSVQPDADGDGLCDPQDRCPFWADGDQTDTDGDGRGDACECGDQNLDGRNDVVDLIEINRAIFNPALATPLCDANGDELCNVADIVAANAEIYSPGNTSTCARQPVAGP